MTKKTNKKNQPITTAVEEDEFSFIDDDDLDLVFTDEEMDVGDELDFDDDDMDADDDLDSDDNEMDMDDDLDSDGDEMDVDDDFDSDDDEMDVDDDLDNDGERDDDDLFSDTDDDMEDPFAFSVETREAALPANEEMLMTVTDVTYKDIPAKESKYNKAYRLFTFVGEIQHPSTEEIIKVQESGTTRNKGFIQKVTAINNDVLPKSLNELKGQECGVIITHNTDALGNVWDNIASILPLSTRKVAKRK